MRRRRELAGASEAWEVRFEEAFGGRTRSASLRALRLRWGRSSFGGGVEGVDLAFGASFRASIEPFSSCIEDVRAPLFEAARAFSSKEFAEKYSARNRGVVPVPATVARSLDATEKLLVTG